MKNKIKKFVRDHDVEVGYFLMGVGATCVFVGGVLLRMDHDQRVKDVSFQLNEEKNRAKVTVTTKNNFVEDFYFTQK